MQPVVDEKLDFDFLIFVITSERMICDLNVQPAIAAQVLITAGAPMLPLPDLSAGPLLPHLMIVIQAFGRRTIGLKCKVLIRVWIVVRELALRAANDDIIRLPREFLNIGTVVS